MKKRLFSVLLSLVMVFSMLPTTVLAAAHSTTVAFSDLALYDTIAVGTEITGLTNGLNIAYFTPDNNIAVHKSYTGTSCIVEGRVVNAENTSIAAPQSSYWDIMNIDAASESITLRSTDPIPAADLSFYIYDPNILDRTISTSPTNSWPTNMTKTGYTWYGWSLIDGTTVTQAFADACQRDTDIFGRWTDDATGELYPAIYSVSFDYNDNATAAVTESTSLRGGVLGWPANPTRSGYTFDGWKDANGVTYTASSTFTADTALTAQWTEGTAPAQITVTFHPALNSTDVMAQVTIDAGTSVAANDWPEIGLGVGYSFEGWFLADGTKIETNHVFTQDTDVYCHVTYTAPESETVEVRCHVGDEVINTFQVEKGNSFNDLPDVNSSGFIFKGWATDAEDASTIISEDYIFNADTDLYAIFEEDPNGGTGEGGTEHVRILFYVDDEVFAEHGILKGATLDEIPEANKENHKFIGWATDVNDHSTIIDANTAFDTDTELYAIFEEDPNAGGGTEEHVRILFYVDDEVIAEHGIPKGTAVEEFPEVNMNGYVFLGWATVKDDADTIIAPAMTFDADTELYAIFEEDPNAGVVENPVVAMDVSVVDGKITGLPTLGEGLKFMYLAIAEGDSFMGATVTRDYMETVVEEMNSLIGQDIEWVTMDEESHDNAFVNLTASTTITKEGEFALVVVAVDSEIPDHNDRRIFGMFADIVENSVTPGEIKDTTPSTNTGGAKLTNTAEELKAAVDFTKDELESIENGEDVQIWLEVTDITKTVSETDKKLVAAKSGTYTVGMYVDASMFMQVGDANEEKLTDLKKEVTITITLPDSLINTNKNLFRNYRVIRVHDGEAKTIVPTFNATNKTLTFKTDSFSTYAVAYSDSTVPKTGDTADVFLWTALLALSLTGLVMTNKKRKHN